MKNIAASILIMGIAVSLFSGCGNSKQSAVVPEIGSGKTEAGTRITRIITDSLGRKVEIPATVETIVPLGSTPRMITYLGLADRVAGIGSMDPERISPVTAYAYVNRDRWSKVPVVGTDAHGSTNYYPEQIISVDPDVIVCSYNTELADEIQKKTGVPVVAVPKGTLFGKDYEAALRLLGDVCGATDRAEALIAYIRDCLQDLKTRTEDIPDTDKPTVLGAAATYKGAHGIEGVYSRYAVFEAISAKDVTAGIVDKAGVVMVDKEQIIGWNPRFIFLDSGGVNLVQLDYTKNPDFYAQLTAVTEGRLYQYPSSTSYFSNVEIPLVNSYYVAGILYPEQFEDIDFEKKADEIFRFFLGTDGYLRTLETAGVGYGKVVPGDR